MSSRYILLWINMVVFISIAFSQPLQFQIDAFTHTNTISDFRIEGNRLYAATTGGLVIYDISANQTIEKLTVVDGLLDHRLTALDRDSRGKLIIGSLNGIVSFYDEESHSFTNDASLQGNEIVDVLAIEDTLWVLASNFVSVFLFDHNLNRFQFRESYHEFGLNVGSFREIAYRNQRVWLASNVGLVNAPGNFLRYNLYASSNWNIKTTADGLPTNNIFAVLVDDANNRLLMGTALGLVIYDFQTFTNIRSGLKSKKIKHLFLKNNQLYAAESRAVFQFENDHFQTIAQLLFADITALTGDDNGGAWIGIEKRGLRNLSTGQAIRFDGPLDNYIGEITKDSQGRIWLTSGLVKDERKQGIFVMTPNGFVNFFFSGGNNGQYQTLNSSLSVFEDQAGNVWVGSWGGGVVVFDPELNFQTINPIDQPGRAWISSIEKDDTLEVTTPTNFLNVFSPVPENPYSVVITDIIPDPNDQTIWLLNTKPADGNAILHYKDVAFGPTIADPSAWETFPSPQGKINWFEMSWDIFGDLWAILEQDGVYQIRIENGALNFAHFNESDNMKSNATIAIATDLDGFVWIGTKSGLNAIQGGQVFDFREAFQPIGLRINDIYVDSRNNKWFATDKGVSLLKASGSPFDPQSWVDLIPENSTLDPEVIGIRSNVFRGNLPSEEIHSIYLDEATGDLYLGTDAGLAVVRDNPFASTFETFDQLKVGPIPYVIEDGKENMLNFFNLVPGSEVRILTVNGQVVRVLSPDNFNEIRGSQAQWDGRNMEGKAVSTGVYLYLVTSGDGQSTTGKILVVQK